MYHNFFIHSSVDGHLGHFHVQGIVNSAEIKTGVHVSFSIMVSSGYMPNVRLLGHMVVLFLDFFFKGIYILFYIVAGAVCIPNSNAKGFLFSTSSPVFIACKFFDDGHFDWCEVIPHCSFDLHFSKNE